MHGRGGSQSRRRADLPLATLLSLQLLLLAFFVLLTAFSRFEGDRTRRVIDSVQSAFGPLIGSPGRAEDEAADAALVSALRDEIGGLLETAVPLTRVEAAVAAETVRIDLPSDAFFRPGDARLNPARATVLGRLVAALDRRPAGLRYELEILQAEGPSPDLAVARADALVRALAEAGAPRDSLSVGLRPGDPTRIELLVRLTEPEPRAPLFDALADRQ